MPPQPPTVRSGHVGHAWGLGPRRSCQRSGIRTCFVGITSSVSLESRLRPPGAHCGFTQWANVCVAFEGLTMVMSVASAAFPRSSPHTTVSSSPVEGSVTEAFTVTASPAVSTTSQSQGSAQLRGRRVSQSSVLSPQSSVPRRGPASGCRTYV